MFYSLKSANHTIFQRIHAILLQTQKTYIKYDFIKTTKIN